MRLYLDLCCLKRPFDDQRQTRVHLESEAVLALMAESMGRLEFVRSAAHDLENEQNPLPVRAKRVRQWLDSLPIAEIPKERLKDRTAELLALGFKSFDALHLASAELASAEVFATCDDRLLAMARRIGSALAVQVLSPVELATEVLFHESPDPGSD